MNMTERKTPNSQQQKVAVITGASKGIGLATAKIFSQKGYKVYDLSRSGKDNEWCKHIFCDVSRLDSIENAKQIILSENKKIDVLVCNAGYGISGAIEFTTEEDAKKQFDVNFFGAFSTAKSFLSVFRRQKQGKIIFIGSVAGNFAIPFQAFYSASKSALASLACCLRQEVKQFGIKVTIILPGDTQTNFTQYREKSDLGCDVYANMQKSVNRMEKDETQGKSADGVAKVVYRYANKKNPPVAVTVGASYKMLNFVKRILSETFVNDTVGNIYCKK